MRDSNTALMSDSTATVKRANDSKQIRRKKLIKQNIPLFIMFILPLLYFIIFRYIPMGGLVIAFKSYRINSGIWGSAWVGLRNFEMLFQNPVMFRIIRNTFMLSVLGIIIGFPFPIILALMINEVKAKWYKKSVQTLVYLPHFLNWVIVGGMVISLFATNYGTVNIFLQKLGFERYPFLYRSYSWMAIYFGSGIWKGAGWGSIIYLAVMSGINPEVYEAAKIDGANRIKQVWHVTIPAITPTIIIILILAVESVMAVGFDQIYILSNPVVSDISEVISLFTYRMALAGSQYSISTAMGLFESVIGLILVVSVNSIARKYNTSLW